MTTMIVQQDETPDVHYLGEGWKLIVRRRDSLYRAGIWDGTTELFRSHPAEITKSIAIVHCLLDLAETDLEGMDIPQRVMDSLADVSTDAVREMCQWAYTEASK